MALGVRISWQAQDFVDLEVQEKADAGLCGFGSVELVAGAGLCGPWSADFVAGARLCGP